MTDIGCYISSRFSVAFYIVFRRSKVLILFSNTLSVSPSFILLVYSLILGWMGICLRVTVPLWGSNRGGVFMRAAWQETYFFFGISNLAWLPSGNTVLPPSVTASQHAEVPPTDRLHWAMGTYTSREFNSNGMPTFTAEIHKYTYQVWMFGKFLLLWCKQLEWQFCIVCSGT
jgi:hypothetical protein